MRLSEWNKILVTRYFSRHLDVRVYFRVDDAELAPLNVEMGLGLEQPADDLIQAVRREVQGSPTFGWLRRQADAWRLRADPDESPPWLGGSALSVLVVARETKRGEHRVLQGFLKRAGPKQQTHAKRLRGKHL